LSNYQPVIIRSKVILVSDTILNFARGATSGCTSVKLG
jgi:hypothetical protein